MALFVMLTVGFFLGRLWAAAIATTRLQECPRCALDASEQRAQMAVGALQRQAERRMAHTAQTHTPHSTADEAAMPRQK